MLNNLPPQAFARRDEAPDQEFYRFERLVTHIDAAAVAAVTQAELTAELDSIFHFVWSAS